jgi:hypothetical protein
MSKASVPPHAYTSPALACFSSLLTSCLLSVLCGCGWLRQACIYCGRACTRRLTNGKLMHPTCHNAYIEEHRTRNPTHIKLKRARGDEFACWTYSAPSPLPPAQRARADASGDVAPHPTATAAAALFELHTRARYVQSVQQVCVSVSSTPGEVGRWLSSGRR